MSGSQAQGGVGLLDRYDTGGFFCEMMGREPGTVPAIDRVVERLTSLPLADLRQRAQDAERELFNLGITFTVYSEKDAIDRILPFDVIPRVLSARAWRHIEAGIQQRVKALNLFLWDVYHDQQILKDGTVPADLVLGNANFCPAMMGLDPPCGTYIHINGTDI